MSIKSPSNIKEAIIYLLSLGVLGFSAPYALTFGRGIHISDNALAAEAISYVAAGFLVLVCWQFSIILMNTVANYIANRNSAPPPQDYEVIPEQRRKR